MISFFSGWKKMIKDLEGDKGHVLILFFLYCLQGIPLGLVNNLKFLMRLNLLWKLGQRHPAHIVQTECPLHRASHLQLLYVSIFYEGKINPEKRKIFKSEFQVLWAPIVDSIFWARFGRRKSWLVPSQYLIGEFMHYMTLHASISMPFSLQLTAYCRNFNEHFFPIMTTYCRN